MRPGCQPGIVDCDNAVPTGLSIKGRIHQQRRHRGRVGSREHAKIGTVGPVEEAGITEHAEHLVDEVLGPDLRSFAEEAEPVRQLVPVAQHRLYPRPERRMG